ncbi:histidine phosphatase family protein [Azospirillum sp. TSA2s]|uniref:histidine phosphatase family protein n=1 Tax=Azospirillum sp. TSA2s TaxID=709810 RepID=UPI0010A9CBD1|nr:histidine phosphatase family protein [Azospirillum sp. TSA2s]QCG92438.1 histidine phosphatase family protein [Azospirillum sp. TSA2s]
MIRLAFLRHGITAWNREGRIQGRTDIPLDPEGRDRLARLTLPAEWRDAILHASPLSRAVETARILGNDRPVHTDPRLIEMDWGAWEGRRGHDLRADPASGYRDLEHWGWDFRPPGGESPADVRDRLIGWLDSLSRPGRGKGPMQSMGRVRGDPRNHALPDPSATPHPPHACGAGPLPLPGRERAIVPAETHSHHLIVTHIGVIRVALALAWGWDFRGPPPVPVKRGRLYAMALADDGTLHPAGPREGQRLS